MIIYSEILEKKFDSVDECLKAEKEHEEKVKAEAEAKAKYDRELKDAYDAAMAACERYLDLAGITVEINGDGDEDHGYYKDANEIDLLNMVLKLF